jgi:hypothetical protein
LNEIDGTGHGRGNATRFVLDLPLRGQTCGFGTSLMVNLRPTVAIDKVELSEVPDVADREAAPEAEGQRYGQALQTPLKGLSAIFLRSGRSIENIIHLGSG